MRPMVSASGCSEKISSLKIICRRKAKCISTPTGCSLLQRFDDAFNAYYGQPVESAAA